MSDHTVITHKGPKQPKRNEPHPDHDQLSMSAMQNE